MIGHFLSGCSSKAFRRSSVPFTGRFRPLRSPEPSSTSLRSHTRFRLRRCQLYTTSVRCRLRRTFPGATLLAHHGHTQTSGPQCTPESRAFWLRPEEHWSRQTMMNVSLWIGLHKEVSGSVCDHDENGRFRPINHCSNWTPPALEIPHPLGPI